MIRRTVEKIKSLRVSLTLIDSILIMLAVVALMGVVLWAQREGKHTGVTFLDEAFTVNFASDAAFPLVGSVSGEKYYPVGCRAAGRIKPENRLYFSSVIESIGAGYSAASGC